MHNDYLLKYKIGFGALGFLTLIGLIMLLAQSGAVRHDNKIYKQANEIATKLNRYTDTNGKAPGRLEYIGVDDIPEDITYTKLATDKYKFCVNYERKSSNISTSYRLYQMFTGSHYYDDYATQESDYLYITPIYREGNNCQTVKVYNYSYPETSDPQTQSL